MKLPYLIAIAGWYLMIPHYPHLHEPINQQHYFDSYDTAEQCKKDKEYYYYYAGNLDLPKDEVGTEQAEWLYSSCIASDDPRLVK
jgi:hypothetical protein